MRRSKRRRRPKRRRKGMRRTLNWKLPCSLKDAIRKNIF
jgi:hypothetical protein